MPFHLSAEVIIRSVSAIIELKLSFKRQGIFQYLYTSGWYLPFQPRLWKIPHHQGRSEAFYEI